MSQSQPSGEFAISRLDLETVGTFGWQVRLQRRGVRFQRYFGDKRWGGKREALLRARQYRDRVLARIADGTADDNATEPRVRSHSSTVDNRSGMVGVTRVRRLASNGCYYESWQATWSPRPGRRKCVRFSVRRYGDDEAFLLACEARLEAIGAVLGRGRQQVPGRDESSGDGGRCR